MEPETIIIPDLPPEIIRLIYLNAVYDINYRSDIVSSIKFLSNSKNVSTYVKKIINEMEVNNQLRSNIQGFNVGLYSGAIDHVDQVVNSHSKEFQVDQNLKNGIYVHIDLSRFNLYNKIFSVPENILINHVNYHAPLQEQFMRIIGASISNLSTLYLQYIGSTWVLKFDNGIGINARITNNFYATNEVYYFIYQVKIEKIGLKVVANNS